MSESKNLTYHEEVDRINTLKLREYLSTLPPFCELFFRGIKETTSSRTRLAYAFDLRLFFDYLHQNHPVLKTMDINDMDTSILDIITKLDIEEFIDHCEYYEKNDKVVTNKERGKMRKIATIRSMYKYFYKSELIKNNPAALVDMPKKHEKEIIRLDSDEVTELLDAVDEGKNVTKNEEKYFAKNRLRDLAILTLMLGTGIRVSECVGLNIEDVDFINSRIKIYRKGGYESLVYFGEEIAKALQDYLDERNSIVSKAALDGPLFLSLQNKRIGVRTVELLVKKYTHKITTIKKITPHKLRSTYGTNLYKESGDIYLVAEVLGHKDVNTTRKHYAAISDDEKRRAVDYVHLRNEKNIDNPS